MSGPRDRIAAVTGVHELGEVTERLGRLEVAVAENQHLEQLLEPQVEALERAVHRLLEGRPCPGRP